MVDSSISHIPLFAALPPRALDALAEMTSEVIFPVGGLLCKEGEYGDRAYIIIDGCVEIIKALCTADERLLDIRGAGEFIGEMSLLNGDGLRTASVRARTETHALELTRASFEMLLRCHPSLSYEMLRVLSTRLRESNDSAIRDLHAQNEQLRQAYADLQAAQARAIEQETLMHELQLAREIQESILPPQLPRIAGFDIGARMIPARMVGGDFFDIIPLGPDRVGIAIGDVSGKGVPAALFMTLASSLLRAEVTRGTPPEDAIQLLNQQLMARNAKGMFVTLLYGELRYDTGEFRYVRAGHDLPLGWDASGALLPVAFGHGLPLGLFPDLALDVQTLPLPPGGTLLLYTDGASEAMDIHNNLLGHDRLSTLARSQTVGSAQELCDQLVQAILDYHGEAPQSDDITFVAVRGVADN